MATKTISITEEAYERLKTRKFSKDSFSDVINKLTGKKSLRELAGILNDKEGEKLMESVKRGREKSRKRAIRMLEELR